MALKYANPNHELVDYVQDKIADKLVYLRNRWQDEKEYEDFGDYIKVIRKEFKSIMGAKFIGMEARPFGCYWIGSDGYSRFTCISGKYIKTLRVPQ